MQVEWYAIRFIDRLRPGDKIPEGAYSGEKLEIMLKNRLVRREVIEAPKPTRKKTAAKKATKPTK